MNLHMDHVVKEKAIDVMDSILLFIAMLLLFTMLGTAFVAVV